MKKFTFVVLMVAVGFTPVTSEIGTIAGVNIVEKAEARSCRRCGHGRAFPLARAGARIVGGALRGARAVVRGAARVVGRVAVGAARLVRGAAFAVGRGLRAVGRALIYPFYPRYGFHGGYAYGGYRGYGHAFPRYYGARVNVSVRSRHFF